MRSEAGGDLVEARAKFNMGASNHEVASALFISEHTVKDHIKSIMNKLGVNSRP